ncbi:pentatricopeptide repeat-containing protein At5g67570, chloroplastic [Morus notabilis]|uniref:pentatricopeptide repeat-containing protein At5g67570, chloroplastic n=1 Tax=Morus notabilis TaxID=981085 RepID=UPI000CED017F|nr:pentatricopeptide repeat-containing protein At5g67570, chloroplastic [Morus notabilis]
MEALSKPPQIPSPQFEPDTERIKRNLLKKGVDPTPKIVHTLRKKEFQKHNRKAKRLAYNQSLTESQKQALAEQSHFQTLRREYKDFNRAVNSRPMMVGRPWESLESVEVAKLSAEYSGEKLKREEFLELGQMFESRKRDELRWALDDDVEVKEEWLDGEKTRWDPSNRRRSEVEVIRFLVDRLCGTKLGRRDWKLRRIMKQSGLEFTEGQVLRIVEGLGAKGCWKQAVSVVEWLYDDNKETRQHKSRFVYTKLLSILGKARRPEEALNVFNTMRGDCYIYPDMAAYRSIAVTLGQAGRVKELLKIMESMRQKPSKRTKNMHIKNWNPVLEPDIVVYNAVLNACVSSHQWKGVSWIFKQLREKGLKPNGATYGLAMEVMLQSGKYDLVHEYFRKMRKSGETPKALTYKVLVRAFWGEGKVNEAVEVVRDMEQRGVVGASSVYYELACCLCSNRRWEDAMLEVEKMKKLSNSRPLEVAFTGMIMSSMQGGHISDCISIFEHMKTHCSPNIGTLNIMLKVYGRNDMFSKAKELFEEIKKRNSDSCSSFDGGDTFLIPDEYTYNAMLEASASALQWEYFEYVYKEMVLSGYQLDQNKHASLLPEASRAGKWHLLEHAFDAILEAGEIPNSQYFTEMVLQATARHDYDRAVTLVNAAALAPFQVTEEQWKDFFEKNRERISQDNLEKLLRSLDNCNVKSEATVVNLSRALRGLSDLSESGASRDFSSSIAFGSREATMPRHSEESIDDDTDSDKDPLLDSSDVSFSVSSVVQASSSTDIIGTEMVSGSLNDRFHYEETNLPTRKFGFVEDEVTDDLSDPLHGKLSRISLIENCADVDEMELETLVDGIDDFEESNLPSAYEVLEAWKERRKKDGMLFSFQLGQM